MGIYIHTYMHTSTFINIEGACPFTMDKCLDLRFDLHIHVHAHVRYIFIKTSIRSYICMYINIETHIYSPSFAWGGRPHRRLFWPTQTYIQKIRQKHCFFQCFYNVFRRKHRNLRGFRHKVGPKQWFLQCFQGSGIKKSSMP